MQFDKVLSCVEDLDRGEPQGFKQQCDGDFLLTVGRSVGGSLHACRKLGICLPPGAYVPRLHVPSSSSPPLRTSPACSCGPTSGGRWPTCCGRSGRRGAGHATSG